MLDDDGGLAVARGDDRRVVRLVHRRPLGERDVVRVDHHRIGDRERLAVDDHARGRVEELHPLGGDEAHPRVLGHPRAVGVQVLHDRLRLLHLVHRARVARPLVRGVEAVRDPVGHLVALGDLLADAGVEARLVEGDDVAALPELQRVLGVQQQLVARAAVGAHHHRQVGHQRRARVVHAEHEQLRGALGRGGRGRRRVEHQREHRGALRAEEKRVRSGVLGEETQSDGANRPARRRGKRLGCGCAEVWAAGSMRNPRHLTAGLRGSRGRSA